MVKKTVEETSWVRRCDVLYHSGTDLDHGGECNMRTSRERRWGMN